MDLLQLLTNKDKLDYSENYNYDNNFIGTRLFPQEKTNNLKVSIARLVENGSVPVMAQFHALDSEARIGDRTNYKEIENFIKVEPSEGWGPEQKIPMTRSYWKIDYEMPILKGEDREYVDKWIYVGD